MAAFLSSAESSGDFVPWGRSVGIVMRCVVASAFVLALLVVGLDLLLGALLLDHPVEHEVIFVAHPVEKVFEELAEVANVRLLLEFQTTAVVQVNCELLGKTLSE